MSYWGTIYRAKGQEACSECPAKFTPKTPGEKTCSPSCSRKRHARIQAAYKIRRQAKAKGAVA